MSKFEKSYEYTPGERAGEALEQELFGVVKDVDDIDTERKKVHERMKRDDLLEQEAAMEEVKERQTQNPVDPKQPFANFVRKEVDDLLDLEDDTKLKFYSAVSDSENKTMLDRDFGIDAFFELKKKDGNSIIIPIDLTFKQFKEDPKVMIFSIPDDFPTHARFEKGRLAGLTASEEKIFQKYVEDLAVQITDKIKKNLQQI